MILGSARPLQQRIVDPSNAAALFPDLHMGPTEDSTLTCCHAIAQLGHGTQLFGMWLDVNFEWFRSNSIQKLASEGIADPSNAAAVLLPDPHTMGPTKDFTLTCCHAIAQLSHGTQLFGMRLNVNFEQFCLNSIQKLASEGIADPSNAAAALLPDPQTMGSIEDFTLTCCHAIAQLGHGTQLFGLWLEASFEQFCLNSIQKLASEGIVDPSNAATALLPDPHMGSIEDFTLTCCHAIAQLSRGTQLFGMRQEELEEILKRFCKAFCLVGNVVTCRGEM
jgi:hypothetical protein